MEHHIKERFTALTIFIGALLVYFFVVPNYIETTEEYEIASLSPKFFPELALFSIAGLAAMLFGFTFVKKYRSPGPKDADAWLSPGEQWRAVVSALIIAAYLPAMKLVGFLIATPFVLAGLFLVQGVKGLWKSIVIILCVTLGVYALFLYLMNVHFPMGVFFEWVFQ